MAEITVEAIKKLSEILPQYKDQLLELATTQEAVRNGMVDLADVQNIITNGFATAGTAVNAFTEKMSNLTKLAGVDFKVLGSQILDTESDVGRFALKSVAVLEPMFLRVLPQGTKAFGEFGEAGVRAGQQIGEQFGLLKPIVDKLVVSISKLPIVGGFADALASGVPLWLQTVDAANNLEIGIGGVIAKSGQLNEIINNQTGEFDDLNTVTASFVTNAFQVAQATGTGLDVTLNYAKALAAIPGAATNATMEIDGMGRSFTQLEGTMKVAQAFGLETSDVINTMRQAFLNLDVTGQRAIQLMVNMGTAAQNLQLPVDTVQNFVMSAAEQFKTLGDNSQAALKIMQAFTPALRESGLGPAAITDIVSTLTGGIRSMDTAHKAFISGMSGSQGGIAGAIEMDALMRAGNMDEVMQRTISAMQRTMGGPLVSVEEAADNPALAGQVVKQRAMLQEFGLAKDDAMADRIVDALKAGSAETLGSLIQDVGKSDSERMVEVMQRGHQLQERGNTILTTIANNMRMGRVITGMESANELRDFTGPELGFGMEQAGESATGDMIGRNPALAQTFSNLKGEFAQDLADMLQNKMDSFLNESEGEFSGLLTKISGFKTIFDTINNTINPGKASDSAGMGAVAAAQRPAVPTGGLRGIEANEALFHQFQAPGEVASMPDRPINVTVPPLTGEIDVKVEVLGLEGVIKKEVKSQIDKSVMKSFTGTSN